MCVFNIYSVMFVEIVECRLLTLERHVKRDRLSAGREIGCGKKYWLRKFFSPPPHFKSSRSLVKHIK